MLMGSEESVGIARDFINCRRLGATFSGVFLFRCARRVASQREVALLVASQFNGQVVGR